MPRYQKTLTAVLLLALAAGRASSQEPVIAETPSTASPAAAAIPKISAGSVTLPYGELRALWEAAQSKPAPPPVPKPAAPVPYSVQAARYTFELGTDLRQAAGHADFEVMDFSDGWTAVPLLPTAEARLLGVEPEGSLVTVRDGFYTLLLDGPGRRAIKLRLSVDLPEGSLPKTRSLRLSGPPSLTNELSVTGLPEGWTMEVPGAGRAAAPAAPDNGPAPAVFQLAAGQPITLNLVSEQASKPVPPVPSVWQVEAQSVVRYEEGQLNYNTRLRASADTGAGLFMELSLPASANVLSVAGADLEHWRAARTDAGDARRVELTWKTPDTLRREVVVRYEIAQVSPEGDWRLVSPQIAAAGGRLQSAFYALPTVEGLEFTTGENSAALPVADARRLPAWIAKETGGDSVIAMTDSRPALADIATSLLRARRLPLLRTAQATIEESRFRTRIVTDGAALSEGDMTIRHEGPLTLSLALPEGAQLLTCTVDGRNSAPIDRGGGKIDLALPTGAVGKPNQVRLSYTSRQKPLAPVSGQLALSLPQTDVFVQTLYWDLQIPEAYEVTALEGNVEVLAVSNTTSVSTGAHLRKELLKAERPAAELFYQKRAVTP